MKTIVLFGLVLGALSATGKVFFAEVGEKAVLECGVKSFRSKLEWSRDETILKIFGRNGVPSKGKNQFSQRANRIKETDLGISNVQENDFGTFICVADSAHTEHTLIVVSVSVVPSVALLVGEKATLECKVMSPGSPPTVQWRKPDGSIQHSAKVDLYSVAISDKGTWECQVLQQEERFNKSVTISVKEPDPEPTTPALKKNPQSPKSENGQNSSGGGGVNDWPGGTVSLLGLVWWVWVAIGAGGLVVFILIVVIIVMCKRNRRRRRKFLRMKKAQRSQKPKKYCQCVSQTAAAKPQQGRRREKPSALPLQPLLQE